MLSEGAGQVDRGDRMVRHTGAIGARCNSPWAKSGPCGASWRSPLCEPSAGTGGATCSVPSDAAAREKRSGRNRSPCGLSAAAAGYQLHLSTDVRRGLPTRGTRAEYHVRNPHTLLAMAEDGHGVAIIPSSLPTHRSQLRIVGLTYQGKPLREPLAIFWDKRRSLPSYATAFCKMLADHARQMFPVTRPAGPEPGAAAKKSSRQIGRASC